MGIPKIVILEDNPERMKSFNRKLIGRATVISFDNVEDFSSYIEENKEKIDMFFLDHDLGGMIYVPSENHNTGYQAALKIVEVYGEDYPEIIIHSMNNVGADNMHSILKKADKLPFPTLIRGL